MKLFRAEPISDALLSNKPRRWRPTMRLPVNVPFFVDNLWEYLRPEEMPCRRHAVFASPTPGLAIANGSSSDKGRGFAVYELAINGPVKLAQLRVKDARDHNDIRHIVGALPAHIAELGVTAADRQGIALLFLPGATRAQWLEISADSAAAAALIREMSAKSTFWADASSSITDGDGEVLFELGEGGSYVAVNSLTWPCMTSAEPRTEMIAA